MKLSIITVNYNNKEGLIKTIESVKNQTTSDYEWIIIDGGSTDGSKEIIESNSDRFAYWCCEKDNGVYDAMNKGIALAHGEFVNFMNSGDVFASNDVVEKFLTHDSQSDIYYGDVIYVETSGEKTIHYPDVISYDRFPKSTINHQSAFIRTSFAKAFPYELKYRLAADRNFWTQALLHGAKFEHLDFVVARYDCQGMSSMQSNAVDAECLQIYEDTVPQGLSSLIDELNKYRTIVAYNPELEHIYKLLNKRRLFKRIITFVIKVLERF